MTGKIEHDHDEPIGGWISIILVGAVWFVWVGGWIWVAVHFIRKFW